MRTAHVLVILASFAAGLGCSKKPTALSVCEQLTAAGVASNCRAATPEGLSVGAKERADFDLPSVPGKTGAAMTFAEETVYDRTVDSYSKMAALAGPHRYGSRKALVFVQMNDGASADIGAKAKAVVDGL